MRMRCQAVDQGWRDDASKERHSVVFKYINILDMNISKSLRICATYKSMLCIMGIQSSIDIIL
jgi:hypothetical protein